MGIPPNHPFEWDFPLKIIYFGVPLFWETPVYFRLLPAYFRPDSDLLGEHCKPLQRKQRPTTSRKTRNGLAVDITVK